MVTATSATPKTDWMLSNLSTNELATVDPFEGINDHGQWTKVSEKAADEEIGPFPDFTAIRRIYRGLEDIEATRSEKQSNTLQIIKKGEKRSLVRSESKLETPSTDTTIEHPRLSHDYSDLAMTPTTLQPEVLAEPDLPECWRNPMPVNVFDSPLRSAATAYEDESCKTAQVRCPSLWEVRTLLNPSDRLTRSRLTGSHRSLVTRSGVVMEPAEVWQLMYDPGELRMTITCMSDI